MARRRFFVDEVRRGTAELTGEDAEHLVRVLRAEVDDLYEISDNRELYLAKITTARKSIVEFEVIEKLEALLPAGNLKVAAALFKFDRFEWMVEKATELGVNEIIPFEAIRTERGLLQAAAKRKARWERIAVEASQQSRRLQLPEICNAVKFLQALKVESGLRLFLDEDAGAQPIQSVLGGSDVALMVGPEGGWTDPERAQAKAAGWLPCSLGRTILRAETAAIAGLAIVRGWLER